MFRRYGAENRYCEKYEGKKYFAYFKSFPFVEGGGGISGHFSVLLPFLAVLGEGFMKECGNFVVIYSGKKSCPKRSCTLIFIDCEFFPPREIVLKILFHACGG